MKSGRRVLCTILTGALFFCQTTYGASEVKEAKRAVAAHEIHGLPLAALYAASCSDSSWPSFRSIVKRRALLSWENQTTIELKVKRESSRAYVRDEARDLEVRYSPSDSKEPFELVWRGQSFRGRDGCELITKIDGALVGHGKNAIWSALLPQAFAQISPPGERVDEDKSSDLIGVTAAVVGLGLLLPAAWPAVASIGVAAAWTTGFAFTGLTADLLLNGYFGAQAYHSLHLKEGIGDLLNKDLSLECTPTLTVIHSGETKIVVRKGWNYSIDIMGKDGVTPQFTDHDVDELPRSREFITNVARKCDTPEQAKDLTAQFTSDAKALEAKMNSLTAAGSDTGAPTGSGLSH